MPALLTDILPVIRKDTIIVAATHASIETGAPTKDGWFLSDFYALNYLLKGTLSDQTWLTAATPEDLLLRYGDLVHGLPYQKDQQRVVLSRRLLESDEITPVTVVRPEEMTDRLFEVVIKASFRAKQDQFPLLLVLFCYGFPGHHFFLDGDGDLTKGFGISRLRKAIDPAVSVALVTTNCFSGSWSIIPDLQNTAAASRAEPATSDTNYSSLSVSDVIDVLTDASTPLLPDENRPQIPTIEDADIDTRLQPQEPTEAQTQMYDRFCESIIGRLGASSRDITCRLLEERSFFPRPGHTSSDDGGEKHEDTQRSTGLDRGAQNILLALFRERWDKLESSLPYSDFDRAIEASVAKELLYSKVYAVARIFLGLCNPGDWQGGMDVGLGARFSNFLRGNPDCATAEEIASIIFFRWDACTIADRFISQHNLPRPNDEMCILWHQLEYRSEKYKVLGGCQKWDLLYGPVWEGLVQGGAILKPAEGQGPRFYRPIMYVASAIVELTHGMEGGKGEAKWLVGEYCDFVKDTRMKCLKRVLEDEVVRRAARRWLESLGLFHGRSNG